MGSRMSMVMSSLGLRVGTFGWSMGLGWVSVLVILWGVGIALPPTHGPRVVYEIQTENHNLIDEMKMRCFSGKRDFSFYCPLLSGKSQLNLEIGE